VRGWWRRAVNLRWVVEESSSLAVGGGGEHLAVQKALGRDQSGGGQVRYRAGERSSPLSGALLHHPLSRTARSSPTQGPS
jgi:hypothetical protein